MTDTLIATERVGPGSALMRESAAGLGPREYEREREEHGGEGVSDRVGHEGALRPREREAADALCPEGMHGERGEKTAEGGGGVDGDVGVEGLECDREEVRADGG